jgi:hypothetical protein
MHTIYLYFKLKYSLDIKICISCKAKRPIKTQTQFKYSPVDLDFQCINSYKPNKKRIRIIRFKLPAMKADEYIYRA